MHVAAVRVAVEVQLWIDASWWNIDLSELQIRTSALPTRSAGQRRGRYDFRCDSDVAHSALPELRAAARGLESFLAL